MTRRERIEALLERHPYGKFNDMCIRCKVGDYRPHLAELLDRFIDDELQNAS
jgi:hypothetical protein